MTHSSSHLSGSTTERAFIQERVAQIGLLAALLSSGFMVLRLLMLLAGTEHVSRPGPYVFHAIAIAVAFVAWLLCRGSPRSLKFIRAVDLGLVLGMCASLALMGATMPLAIRPDFIVLLASTYVLVVRAALVPSQARFTLLTGVLVASLALVINWLHWRADAVEVMASFQLEGTYSPTKVASLLTANNAAFWFGSVGVTSVISKVIYGLRRDLQHQRQLGQYTLLGLLGEGGMGKVYRAEHALLRRPTALKLLEPETATDAGAARFEREVQLTAELTHPNTIRIYDYGRTQTGVFYYAMEYLEGLDLDQLVTVFGPLPAPRVLHILEQVTSSLREAHERGLIHRDIKPANIMLVRQGAMSDVAKVLDFGLVKQLDAGAADQSKLTVELGLAGTPAFMSPESIRNPLSVDERSDLYAVGALGHYLLTGSALFDGESPMEICAHHLHTAPPSLSDCGLDAPPDLEALLLRCLDKDVSARPTSARQLRLELMACADYGRWTSDDADAWWAEHDNLLNPVVGNSSPDAETVQLDVDPALRATQQLAAAPCEDASIPEAGS